MECINVEISILRTMFRSKNVTLKSARFFGSVSAKEPFKGNSIVTLLSFRPATSFTRSAISYTNIGCINGVSRLPQALPGYKEESDNNMNTQLSSLSLRQYHRQPFSVVGSPLLRACCNRRPQPALCSSRGRASARAYSTDNREDNEQPRTEIKGVVVHLPHPIEWIKNIFYLVIVQGWLDSSFNRQDFLYGARQAVCHLTRLAVMKDFDAMKSVASIEVVERMKEIVSSLSVEQIQSIEILPDDINLAKFTVASVRYQGEGCIVVCIDVFCVAVRMFGPRPLLIQTIIRFSRDYAYEKQSDDWRIVSIQEFNIKDLGSANNDDIPK